MIETFIDYYIKNSLDINLSLATIIGIELGMIYMIFYYKGRRKMNKQKDWRGGKK